MRRTPEHSTGTSSLFPIPRQCLRCPPPLHAPTQWRYDGGYAPRCKTDSASFNTPLICRSPVSLALALYWPPGAYGLRAGRGRPQHPCSVEASRCYEADFTIEQTGTPRTHGAGGHQSNACHLRSPRRSAGLVANVESSQFATFHWLFDPGDVFRLPRLEHTPLEGFAATCLFRARTRKPRSELDT